MKRIATAFFVYFCITVQLYAEECDVHYSKELGIEYPATEFNLFDEFLLDLSKLPQLDPPVKNLSSNPVYRAYIAPSDTTIMIFLTEDRVTFFKLCSSRDECNSFARVYYIDSLIVEEFRRLHSAGVLPGTATEADSMVRHAIQMMKSAMPSVDNISLSGCVYNLYKPTGDSDKGGRVMSTAGLCVYEDKDGTISFCGLVDSVRQCPELFQEEAPLSLRSPAVRAALPGMQFRAFDMNGNLIRSGKWREEYADEFRSPAIVRFENGLAVSLPRKKVH